MDRMQYDMRGNLIVRLRNVIDLPDHYPVPEFIIDASLHQLNQMLEKTFFDFMVKLQDE